MRFILVDRIDQLVPGESIVGIKNLTLSDDVFEDHFPGHPVFPGTLMVEALAQLSGCLVECTFHARSDATRRAVLVQIERAKFHAPCGPGDQLQLRSKLVSEIEGTAAQVEAQAFSNDQCVTRATLNFRLVEVESETVHRQRRELYRTWMRNINPSFPVR